MNHHASKQELVITRVFDYPVDLVWDAWTDPSLVMKWWGPAHFSSPSCKIDLREGGSYLFCMRAPESFGGQDYYSAGVYKRIVPQQRLEFTQVLADAEGNAVKPSDVGMPEDFPAVVDFVIDFISKGEQTELIIRESNWSPGPMADNAVTGMNQSLDKLAASLT
ncbi:uncharacterized protein YndB with AHSA1/START domain [Paenibacillus favisporus]|uniref:Uncharacterized protein YndB with AHSA1/START domain n=1 Tax=Paenibacillus favisporus TaxID=221028 RepID=A0ABV2F4K7_9BACL